MWTFDGEEWTDDNAPAGGANRRDKQAPPWDEHFPELQILEIVHVPRTNHVPPYPQPRP